MPGFAVHTMRSIAQVRRAAGYRDGALLADRKWTFWTLTAWGSEAAMRAYMVSGSHRRAMPKLLEWCDEASVAHWVQKGDALPAWEEADRRMRQTGRPSKVRNPSAGQAGLRYAAPRMTLGGRIGRVG